MTPFRFLLPLLTLTLLAPSFVHAHPGHDEHDVKPDPAAQMAKAANSLIKWLNKEQKEKALFEFTADERENWHFIPLDRKGLRLDEMSPAQDHYAYALLATGLSTKGFMKATTIMSLEQILAKADMDPVKRNTEKYYVAIFGTPGSKKWGWRFEGHHLSLNYTIIDGEVLGSPAFFGTNPAEVKEGPQKGLRPLGDMEDIGRKLVTSLGEAAIFSKESPRDILSSQDRTAKMPEDQGVKGKDMTPEQKKLAVKILAEFASNTRPELVEAGIAEIEKAADELVFAWAGSTKKGEGHYFRVVMPEVFMVEYANTQNDANHAHAVWRMFRGDFGRDLLKEHMSQAH